MEVIIMPIVPERIHKAPKAVTYRVLRGGGWFYGAPYLRVSSRYGRRPLWQVAAASVSVPPGPYSL